MIKKENVIYNKINGIKVFDLIESVLKSTDVDKLGSFGNIYSGFLIFISGLIFMSLMLVIL